MDDWKDIASAILWGLGIAVASGGLSAVLIYGLVRLARLLPRFRQTGTQRGDLRSAGIVGLVIAVPTLILVLAINFAFSDMCGTGYVTEVYSPDRQHKVDVYNFDCGATTDFSLDVSLLRGDVALPKRRTAKLLYSQYHQKPEANGPNRNFEVVWPDSSHATVRVKGFEGSPITKSEDGVQVRIERLP
jgi:hypothetical protein